MVILHVTGMPFPTKYGGVEKWFVEVCKQAQHKGDKVYVAYLKNTGDVQIYHDQIAAYGGNLIVLADDRAVLDLCRRETVHAVHFHFGFCGHRPLYRKLHRMGCRSYVHFHCENSYHLRKDRDLIHSIRIMVHRIKTWYTAHFFTAFFGCSKTVMRQHQSFYHLPKKKVHLLYLGIPRTPAAGSNGSVAHTVPTIVCTAFHSPIKGVDVLLEALSLLKARSVPFRLIQLGGGSAELDGEDTRLLHDRCHRLGLSQDVQWIGPTNHVEHYLAQGDVYCQPSRTEAICLSIAEAMQYRLPIVASHVGGIPELVHDGENGFLTEAGDPSMLAEKLELLLNDPQLRESMGRASEKILDEIHFYQDESVERLNEFYDQIH